MAFKKTILNQKGFSIVEMLVTIAIISLILGVVIFNQGDFTDQFNLSTTASDLELQIRQAQVFGVSVREFTPASNEFNSAYGVSLSDLTPNSKSYYISFADRGTKNGIYDGDSTCPIGGSSECLSKIVLTRGIQINQICALMGNSQSQCAPSIGRADITFNRPDPSAHIATFNSAGNQNNLDGLIGVRIDLISTGGKIKSVFVYTSGQIATQ
jgi:prepilin-type N-terminal cleavage/methylation domain-containing protein